MSLRRPLVLLALLALVASLLALTPAAAARAAVVPVINEFVANHTGTDSEAFIEVLGPPSTDLSALTLLEIDGDGGSTGVIDYAETLGSTDANGYWLSTEDTENGTLTLLLVEGFSGAVTTDLDLDDDGTLDATPWTNILDEVAVTDGDGGDQTYGIPALDASLEGSSGFSPGGASRIPNGTDTDVAADWVRNDFDGAGFPGFPGTPDDGEALNTPAAANVIIGGPSFTINEVDADTPSTDVAEFVEIYDGGAGTSSLDGLVVVLFNGSNDTSYAAFDLDGLSTDADGFFVICGDAANVANCDLDVTPDQDLVQNGADAVGLFAADATDFPNGTAVTATDIVDAVVYDTNDADDSGLIDVLTPGQPQVNEDGNSDKDNHSNSRCPDGGTALETGTYTQVVGSPGAPNACTPPPVQTVLISEVQGNGAASPLDGQAVTVTAIVTALFEDDDAVEGFFLQEEDADADADATTSEGVFVYCETSCPAPLAVGDQVTVSGVADEFFGMTQVNATGATDVVIDSSGNPLPTAVDVALPAGGPTNAEATFEAVEGMVVTFPTTLAVSEYFELARYGQLVLTETSRPYQFTHDNAPSVAGHAAFVDELAARRIILDDNNNDQNDATTGVTDEAYPYPSAAWPTGGLSLATPVRGGDTVNGLTGVMHWSFAGQSGTDAWRVRPIDGLDYTFDSTSARTAVPDPVGGDLTVASFNVLNYFETIDVTSSNSSGDCGPSGTMDCRGADSAAELQRQQDKIVAALAAIDADVVGLVEIENSATAVQHLVDGLNAAMGAGTYAQVDTGTIGTDAIKVGFIYKPATVTATGAYAILDSTVDARFVDSKNRPTLIQTFTENASGEVFTAAVNHLKSKGSDCSDIGEDESALDGQGNCSETRDDAAAALADFLATDPTGSGDDDVLVLGDLNAYRMEDAITTLEAAGYTDLAEAFVGPDAYSYVFDGQLGYLDYAMANSSLAAQVTGATEWHINADEVPLLDYNDDFKDIGEASFERESAAQPIYAPDAYRASDHDPVLVGLDLSTRGSGGGNPGTPTEPPTEEPTEPPTDDQSIREQCADDATCTSVTVSQQTFVDGTRSLFQQIVPAAVATEALLASDTVFADALASGALQDTRPLLLNDPEALEDEVLEEIQRLGVGAVWILGGVDAVGQDVEDALAAEGLDVRRIAGPTRLETAQAVAELVGTAQPLLARAFPGDGDATQAFADSLAAGGWAADGGRSVLLSQTEMLSDSTAAHLEASIASEATLVGGPAALADAVLDAVRSLGFASDRVAGDNRFATAARIATERGFGPDRMADTVIISEGQADDAWEGGFTAAAPAAVFDAPILLANGDDLPPETLAALADMVEADADVMCLAAAAACEAAIEAIG